MSTNPYPPPPPPNGSPVISNEQVAPNDTPAPGHKPQLWILLAIVAAIALIVGSNADFWRPLLSSVLSTGPDKNTIEDAINGSLSKSINGSGRLFESYEITNKYTRQQDNEKWYYIEYAAICPVVGGPKTFTGTVRIVRRGSKWYWVG